MALNRIDKSRILRRYFPGMTRNSEMSTEPRQLARTFSLNVNNPSGTFLLAFDTLMAQHPAALDTTNLNNVGLTLPSITMASHGARYSQHRGCDSEHHKIP